MVWVFCPLVRQIIQSLSNKFVTGVKIKSTSVQVDKNVSDSPACLESLNQKVVL